MRASSQVAWGMLGLSLLAITAVAQKPARSVTDLIAEALVEGYQVGGRHAQSADALLAEARKQLPDDPCLEYAAGLIWLKQMRPGQATASFDASRGRRSGKYWPAWRAQVWCRIRDKKLEEGLQKLEDLADHAVARARDDAPEVEVSVRFAGQVIAALERLETQDKAVSVIGRTDSRLRERFAGDLAEIYAEGKAAVDETEDRLKEEARDKALVVADRKDKATESQKARVDENLARAADQKAEAKKTAEEWHKWMDGELRKLDKQLASLEKDYAFFTQRANSVRQSIVLVGQEISGLELQIASNRARSQVQNNFITPQELQLQQRQQAMLNYQKELTDTEQQLAQVSQQGAATVSQKLVVAKQYEQATGKLADTKQFADKWTTRLQKEKAKLQAKTTRKPLAKVSLSFPVLVPFDLDAERTRVLKDIGAQASR